MARKVLGGTLIVLSSILLILSLVGIGAAWYYNEPLTTDTITKLGSIDDELEQAQTALQNAQDELKRALRMVETAEASLQSLSEQRLQAKEFLETVENLLNETIQPNLDASKEKIDQVQETLDDLNKTLENINKIPFVEIPIPDEGFLSFFVENTEALKSEVDRVGDMAEQASTFLNDSSYLLGGDLAETKDNIQDLMGVVDEYETKIVSWREQLADLIAKLPKWIDHASVTIVISLLWFGFSQFGLLLHGLASWRKEDAQLPTDGDDEPEELEA
ncbi:MAG: hypothetical protein HN916_00040 [Anaerolineae bacterium]|nr:hypothetical protein [Anaerolineae bacterium]MBT7992123.1 hypothetical protein [Anaerolineae bacterium]